MVYHETLRAKKWTEQSWQYAQVKLDGHRATFFIDAQHQIVGYGKDHRTHLEFISRFPRLKKTEFYSAIKKMPANSSVDTEIVVPGGTSSDVATALRDPSKPLDIITFAIPCFAGIMATDKSLVWAHQVATKYHLKFAEFFSCSDIQPHFDKGSNLPIKEKLLLLAAKMGYEGFVLKQTQYSGWFKVKQIQTVDAIITGIVWGQGKFEGLIGALVVSLYSNGKLKVIANVSGMIDQERKTLTGLHGSGCLLNQVVEVKYQEVGSRQKLRHPRFSRMRPDKPNQECTWDQLINNC